MEGSVTVSVGLSLSAYRSDWDSSQRLYTQKRIPSNHQL